MSKTTKMIVLEETKGRLEKRIAEIRSIVWGPSPYMEMLELRKKTIAYIKSKTTEEMIQEVANINYLSDAVEEEKRIQARIDAQADSSALISELVKVEGELSDINGQIHWENYYKNRW